VAADREYLFNYRFAGDEWGITIFATNAAEAKEKIKAVALARYEGEVGIKIPAFTGAGIIAKTVTWLKNRTR